MGFGYAGFCVVGADRRIAAWLGISPQALSTAYSASGRNCPLDRTDPDPSTTECVGPDLVPTGRPFYDLGIGGACWPDKGYPVCKVGECFCGGYPDFGCDPWGIRIRHAAAVDFAASL